MTDSRINPDARPLFPPQVVIQIKALACELPSENGVPLSRFSSNDLATEVICRGIVAHEYERMGSLNYLAAWEVQHAKIFGRCEAKTGIESFSRLVNDVMTQEPYASAKRVFWIVDNKGWGSVLCPACPDLFGMDVLDACMSSVMVHDIPDFRFQLVGLLIEYLIGDGQRA